MWRVGLHVSLCVNNGPGNAGRVIQKSPMDMTKDLVGQYYYYMEPINKKKGEKEKRQIKKKVLCSRSHYFHTLAALPWRTTHIVFLSRISRYSGTEKASSYLVQRARYRYWSSSECLIYICNIKTPPLRETAILLPGSHLMKLKDYCQPNPASIGDIINIT